MPPKKAEQRGAESRDGAEREKTSSLSSLSKALVMRDAAAARIVYARVKGFPHWPVSGTSAETVAVPLEAAKAGSVRRCVQS